MDGKTIALVDLNKSLKDLEQSLDITFNGVRQEFDDVNGDIDLLFKDNKFLAKKTTKDIDNLHRITNKLTTHANWLIAVTACNTVLILSILGYLVLQK